VSLNQRLRATQDKERQLNERQEALKLIFADIRAEQSEINRLREQVNGELNQSSQSASGAMKAAQDERDLLRQELDALRTPPAKEEIGTPVERPTTPEPPLPKTDSDPATLKRLGAIYDSMPAEVVAEVLQQLTKQGRDEVVVQLLKNMKDRQAAKVLATIAASDPAKAASLTELLKRP
jgi:flagellar motility protein MotE (MotC chaperone)